MHLTRSLSRLLCAMSFLQQNAIRKQFNYSELNRYSATIFFNYN